MERELALELLGEIHTILDEISEYTPELGDRAVVIFRRIHPHYPPEWGKDCDPLLYSLYLLVRALLLQLPERDTHNYFSSPEYLSDGAQSW